MCERLGVSSVYYYYYYCYLVGRHQGSILSQTTADVYYQEQHGQLPVPAAPHVVLPSSSTNDDPHGQDIFLIIWATCTDAWTKNDGLASQRQPFAEINEGVPTLCPRHFGG